MRVCAVLAESLREVGRFSRSWHTHFCHPPPPLFHWFGPLNSGNNEGFTMGGKLFIHLCHWASERHAVYTRPTQLLVALRNGQKKKVGDVSSWVSQWPTHSRKEEEKSCGFLQPCWYSSTRTSLHLSRAIDVFPAFLPIDSLLLFFCLCCGQITYCPVIVRLLLC